MSTAPLPPIDGDDPPTLPFVPARVDRPAAPSDRTLGPPPRSVRGLEAIAGLLGIGVLVAGVVLAAAAVLAPALVTGRGLDAADGPGWGRVIAHLATGLAAELLRGFRRSWSPPVRAGSAVAVITAVLVLLWFAWWH